MTALVGVLTEVASITTTARSSLKCGSAPTMSHATGVLATKKAIYGVRIADEGRAGAGGMKLLLTTKEAADELRMSEGYVKAQIRAGELRSVKFGRSRRIFSEELRRFAMRKIQVSATDHDGALTTDGLKETPIKAVSYRP